MIKLMIKCRFLPLNMNRFFYLTLEGGRGVIKDAETVIRAQSAAMLRMGLIRAAAILAIDNRFRTLSLELKCLETSFGAQKQKFSIPRDSIWPPCD